MPDKLISSPLRTLEEARAKCEAAAQIVVERLDSEGRWEWVSVREIAVYNRRKRRIATLSVETRND